VKSIAPHLRFTVVAAICFFLGTVLIPLMASAGLHYALAALFAFVIVTLVGFWLHTSWTFDVERSLAGFVRYSSTMALNLPMSIMLIGLGHELMGFSVTFSTIMSSGLLCLWNFLAIRWALIRLAKRETREHS
jgi:putative flippase GtrA